MRSLRGWFNRLFGFVGRDRRETEFDAELESHLQMHIDDNLRAGMTLDDARREALIRLGGVEQTRERYRDRAGLPPLENVLKDSRYALRLMRRNPGFTALVLSTLAVGIGANTAMFSVVNTVLLRPLPYAEPEQLVLVNEVNAVTRAAGLISPPDFYTYREQNQTLVGLDAFYTRSLNLTGGSEPERVPTLVVSSGFFATLGSPPALGRGLVRQDEIWGAHRIAILTDGLWRRRFGADSGIVGQNVTLNGEPFEVVGVLAPGFSFLASGAQLVVPMAFAPGDSLNSHSNYFLRMVGRLRTGVTKEQAAGDLNRLLAGIVAKESINQSSAIDLTSLHEALVGDVRRPVLVLFGAVGFVLLISCANLANLLLARAIVRQREIAVRLAVGATRRRLVAQFLIESVVLAGIGGVLGLGLAYLSIDALNLLSMGVLPRAEAIHVDRTVLTFVFTVAVLTGILLGLAPAAHSIARDIGEALKDSARTASEGKGRHRLRAALVIAEVALSLVLLAGAGLMVKSMYQLLNVETGFSADGVLTMQMTLPPEKYVDLEASRRLDRAAYVKATAFFDEVIQRVRGVSGAQVVGAINGLPLTGEIWQKQVTFFDRPLPRDLSGLSPIQYRLVAGDYFRALGIRVHSGRAFTDDDTLDAPRVAIVNREMMRRHYGDIDPVGKIISVNPPLELLPQSLIDEARRAGTLPDDYTPDKYTIVGVVDDVLYGGLTRAAPPLVYVPFAQGSEGATNMFLVVKTAREPLALVGDIRHRIAQVDGDQPVANIETMQSRLGASVAQPRLQMIVLSTFAALAALLAALGIYGVMSYTVTQRQHEIGIRLALGAARREVVGLILRQGLPMIGIGLALGLAAALVLSGVLRALLFGVSTTDPSVFVTIVLLLSLSACLATYLPARRAARMNPLDTLRNE